LCAGKHCIVTTECSQQTRASANATILKVSCFSLSVCIAAAASPCIQIAILPIAAIRDTSKSAGSYNMIQTAKRGRAFCKYEMQSICSSQKLAQAHKACSNSYLTACGCSKQGSAAAHLDQAVHSGLCKIQHCESFPISLGLASHGRPCINNDHQVHGDASLSLSTC
jgi:hypothetical protein